MTMLIMFCKEYKLWSHLVLLALGSLAGCDKLGLGSGNHCVQNFGGGNILKNLGDRKTALHKMGCVDRGWLGLTQS
jgi:hypothetical protein